MDAAKSRSSRTWSARMSGNDRHGRLPAGRAVFWQDAAVKPPALHLSMACLAPKLTHNRHLACVYIPGEQFFGILDKRIKMLGEAMSFFILFD